MTTAPSIERAPISVTVSRRVDAVTLLSCYIFLLMVVPAWLVLGPLGAAGGPSTVFAALLCAWYVMTWLHPALAPERGRQPVRLAALVFACSILATYVSVNRIGMSTLEENGADRGVIFMAGWVGVLLFTADGIDTLDRFRTLLRRIVMAASFMSAIAITQFFAGLNIASYISLPGLVNQLADHSILLDRSGLNRPSATALDPIELAAVLAMCLPLAIHQARRAAPEVRLRRWLQVTLIGATLPLTVSRTVVLAFVVICLILLPTWPRRDRRIAYVAIGIAIIAVWVTKPSLAQTFRALFLGISSDSSTTSRTDAFSSASPFIGAHPWLGHGFGTFFPQTYFFTDDQYLLTLIETGVIGLLALVVLFVMALYTARQARRLSVDPELRDLAQCLLASVAAGAVAFGTLDAFSFPIISGVTFLLIGCIGAVWRLARREAINGPDLGLLAVGDNGGGTSRW
jgi:polysaccharide biosynthesis protein PslJ